LKMGYAANNDFRIAVVNQLTVTADKTLPVIPLGYPGCN
jgi:hypothetical protein